MAPAKYRRVTTIPPGQLVNVVGCTGNWCAVLWRRHQGYVNARYLSTHKTIITSPLYAFENALIPSTASRPALRRLAAGAVSRTSGQAASGVPGDPAGIISTFCCGAATETGRWAFHGV
jgi:hypothetical protein